MDPMNWMSQVEQMTGIPIVVLALELTVALILFLVARFTHGFWSGVNTRAELAERDNVAFGISLAGGMAGLCLVLTGIFHLPNEIVMPYRVGWLFGLGLVALLLIRLGRWWFDKLALHHIDKQELILQGNVSMALVDAAVAISTALILAGNLEWIGHITPAVLVLLVLHYFIALTLLIAITRLLERLYARLNQGGQLQRALAQGHLPVAIRFSCYILACGLVISVAGRLHLYDTREPVFNILSGLGWTVLGLILLLALSWLMRRVVLNNIRINREVELQNNGGIATLDGALVFAAAYLLSQLISP